MRLVSIIAVAAIALGSASVAQAQMSKNGQEPMGGSMTNNQMNRGEMGTTGQSMSNDGMMMKKKKMTKKQKMMMMKKKRMMNNNM